MHLNRPEVGTFAPLQLPVHMLFHCSYTFNLGERSRLQLFMRLDKVGRFDYVQFSANAILYKYIIVGAGYTERDEYNFRIGGRTNTFTLQFGYNETTSTIYSNSRDSFEIHFSYNLRKKDIRNEVPLFEKM
jgi:hypothetical protein